MAVKQNNKRNEKSQPSYWEFVTHNGKSAAYADYVTARCGACKEPLFCNPHKFMGRTEEDEGTVIFSGFFVGVPKDIKQSILIDAAESRRTELPKYCACCGVKMTKEKADSDSCPF